MRAATKEEAFSITFPDFAVSAFTTSESAVEFRVAGSHVAKPDSRQTGPVKVKVNGWRGVRVLKYNSEGKAAAPIDVSKAEPLREICECQLGRNSALIAGFAATSGVWEEFEFEEPQIEILFDQ
jgi:hypothetical protein